MLSESRQGMRYLYYRYKIYLPERIAKKLDEYIGILDDDSKIESAEIDDKQNLITEDLLNYLANVYAKRSDTKDLILRK